MNFTVEDLVRVAKRENNDKRPYLYVNPLQGKHIPAEPLTFKKMCKVLADKLNKRYTTDKILIIGFAETATAIAMEIAISLNNALYAECTTRENNENSEFSYFTESHSHATEQRLDTKNYKDILRTVDRVVFVEDEVTTGNTIMKLVDILKENYADTSIRFTIASILNSMSEDREESIEKDGIDCIYVEKLPFEYCSDKIQNVNVSPDEVWKKDLGGMQGAHIRNIYIDINQRELTKVEYYREQVNYFTECIFDDLKDVLHGQVVVIGTEEFMHPAVHVASRIAESRLCESVKTHSTTRSPVLPSSDEGYPLYKRFIFNSVYDSDRTTYLYNLNSYDVVILVSDAENEDNYIDICNAIKSAGNTLIYIYRWRSDSDEK